MASSLKKIFAIWLVLINHVVGLVGLSIDSYSALVASLTPFSLLVTAGVLLWTAKRDARFFLAMAMITVAGYVVELAGVHTQILFGAYEYGPNLGPKLAEVPPLIGLNWWLLMYTIYAVVSKAFPTANKIAFALVGASLMVAIDYFIEPFAIRFQLWHWFGQEPPLQNFLAWFVISFLLFLPMQFILKKCEHSEARYVFWVLLLFFISSYIIH